MAAKPKPNCCTRPVIKPTIRRPVLKPNVRRPMIRPNIRPVRRPSR